VRDGDQSGPRAGTDGQWSVSLAIRGDGELVRDCGVVVVVDDTRLSVWVKRRRYEARVEVGCVRRGSEV
jgi:hypothetical protein